MWRRFPLIGLSLLVVLSGVLASGPAAGVDRPTVHSLLNGGEVVVKKVIDGDTVRLAKPVFGLDQIRLVGIQAPKLPLGRKGFKTWPLAEESKRALEKLVRRRKLSIRFGGRRQDRHRRLLAHLFDENDTWIQGEMLRLGMARVYSFPDNRSRVAAMLKIERAARKAKRGIWALPYYAVRTPKETAHHIGTFQLVRGKVMNAAKVGMRVYLNFGRDWRTDFTVMLHSWARRLFRKERIDPLSYKGKVIQVRGWLRKRNGPMIEVTHPEQIELIGKDGKDD